ncbi:14263_t:CDS:10 [Acaulospora colombiana]|uniref:14263_t:CDS:1 n=1 Tax=Acaulospora colombiana TaxID=27376 RepID=A0ACA9K3E5_9GLOM|nr:14263_t:CDS:10 [Acaulospora colombiana]
MALRVPKSAYPQLFKEGYKNLQGVEEAVIRNIQAIHELSEIVRTSFGPNGRNKMVINHLEKLFVTNDAATIIRELEVIHPAAKLVVMASQQQEQEIGDATNFVIILAGGLLQKAEYLLRMGLHPSEIVQGYELASNKALEILEGFGVETVTDLKSKDSLFRAVRPVIAAKQYGNEELLSNLVIEAALIVMPKNPATFNVDNIRVVKIMGSSIHESKVVKGMVFGREPEGVVTKALKAKIGVFTCSLDTAQTETKGTVLIHNAQEMMNFTKGEEQHMEKIFKELADAGINVVVTGSGIGDLALHYLNRFNIMAIKDLRHLRKWAIVISLKPSKSAETGSRSLGKDSKAIHETFRKNSHWYHLYVTEHFLLHRNVTIENENSKTSTIVIRGATQNLLDDIERAIDDGVNIVKAVTRDGRLVPGAGATEMELTKRLLSFGEVTPGINQHSIKSFAEALEVFPRTLAENAGLDATHILSKLYAAHHQDDSGVIGVDIESETEDCILDSVKAGILDSLAAKSWALKFATDAALTVLRVDQIIMSKPAGGPKPPQQNSNWDED